MAVPLPPPAPPLLISCVDRICGHHFDKTVVTVQECIIKAQTGTSFNMKIAQACLLSKRFLLINSLPPYEI